VVIVSASLISWAIGPAGHQLGGVDRLLVMRDHGLQESHVGVVERWLGATGCGGWGGIAAGSKRDRRH